MKIRIVKCSDECWYSRLIGEVFDVYVYDDVDYMTKGNRIGLILKSDCEIVKEEVEKSCSNCKYDEVRFDAVECRTCVEEEYSDWKPKEQQEDKPKKLKYVYVCKECLGSEPCKLKVYGSTAHPNTCPLEKSRKANWKLKKEGVRDEIYKHRKDYYKIMVQ